MGTLFSLLAISLAPVLVILIYIYKRDKYEKEPIGLLLLSLLLGGIIVIPILYVEIGLSNIWDNYFYNNPHLTYAAYSSFVVAAFTEELFKLIAFFIIIWRNKNFNEYFDGIIYAVYISLGFAAIENVMYVLQNGWGTGLLRAFTAVPAHALFGISMGFFLAKAKFSPYSKLTNIILALLVPILLHGTYNFILFSNEPLLLLGFIPIMVLMYIIGFKKMKSHSESSVFKNINQNNTKIQNETKIQNNTNNTDF
jgi:protease PrsW